MLIAHLLLLAASAQTEFPEFSAPQFRIVPANGLGMEANVCRRDPSDVIKHGDTYFVWYTKVRKAPDVFEYPSGYSGTVWYATSPDGVNWTERGEALGLGAAGQFDDHGVFTPGILAARGRFYLFYTAVQRPMTRENFTAIGVAESASPHGPWKRSSNNPVIAPSKDPAMFDSMRVDDACLLIRNGEYWLYYKGRQLQHTPGETKWGIAIAKNPAGPYMKHKANPVHSGHEVLVWPHREGVAALVGPTGPERNTIQYAPDGVRFRVVARFTDPPKAPGGFRPDAFTGAKAAQGMSWGISMIGGPDPYLVRFECDFTPRH